MNDYVNTPDISELLQAQIDAHRDARVSLAALLEKYVISHQINIEGATKVFAQAMCFTPEFARNYLKLMGAEGSIWKQL